MFQPGSVAWKLKKISYITIIKLSNKAHIILTFFQIETGFVTIPFVTGGCWKCQMYFSSCPHGFIKFILSLKNLLCEKKIECNVQMLSVIVSWEK